MSFAKQCFAVFVAMVALDIVFALYVLTTAEKQILASSFWAAMIQVCNVFVVTCFVKDIRLVVPCALGAFVGTALALAYF